MATAAILEVAVGGSGRDPEPSELALPKGVVARLDITVTGPDGSTRTARLECGAQNRASGYLARPSSRAFACETAIVNPTVMEYLTGHKVSGPSCTKTFNPPPPALVAHFKGAIRPSRVDRTLDVAGDPCGEALAVIMFPLLESTARGPSLGGL